MSETFPEPYSLTPEERYRNLISRQSELLLQATIDWHDPRLAELEEKIDEAAREIEQQRRAQKRSA